MNHYSPEVQAALKMARSKITRLDSYPMHLRQERTPVPGFLEEYAKRPTKPPMSLEERKRRDEEQAADWAILRATKQQQT